MTSYSELNIILSLPLILLLKTVFAAAVVLVSYIIYVLSCEKVLRIL